MFGRTSGLMLEWTLGWTLGWAVGGLARPRGSFRPLNDPEPLKLDGRRP